MEDLIIGIDDAGRGPVVGPMILGGVIITKAQERELKKIGVKDSKTVTPKRRDFLEEKIKEIATGYQVSLAFPEEIDKSNAEGLKLNELEAIHFAQIINTINKGDTKMKVVIDCPSPNIAKWSDYLKKNIKNLSNLEIFCEHKADKNHISVAAASILAKSVREREMDLLKEKYGTQIGSGYTSDPSTIRFLEKYALKHKNEGIFRKTWITWKRAIEKLKQEKLNF